VETAIDPRFDLGASRHALGDLERIPDCPGEAETLTFATAIGDQRRLGRMSS